MSQIFNSLTIWVWIFDLFSCWAQWQYVWCTFDVFCKLSKKCLRLSVWKGVFLEFLSDKRTLIIDVSTGINCAYGYNVVKMGVESSILDLRPGSSSLICLSWSVFYFFCNLSISSCLQRDIYGTKMTPIQNVSPILQRQSFLFFLNLAFSQSSTGARFFTEACLVEQVTVRTQTSKYLKRVQPVKNAQSGEKSNKWKESGGALQHLSKAAWSIYTVFVHTDETIVPD